MTSIGRSVVVLLVEDDPGDVLMITEAIEAIPGRREIHVAGDGLEAMAFLGRHGVHALAPRPDLVLLDLNMPRMDGRETLTTIKNDPDLRAIPVVVLTTSSAHDDVARSYDQHANAFVTKPLGLDDLEAAVAQIDAFFTMTATMLPAAENSVARQAS